MKFQSGNKTTINNKIQLLIILILIVNTIIIAVGIYFVWKYVIDDNNNLAYKQEMAHDLSDFNHRLALDSGVLDMPEVREVMAEYNYEVDYASTGDELIRVIFEQGKRVQETIFQAADTRMREKVLDIVSRDAQVLETEDTMHLYIQAAEERVNILPAQFLEPDTAQQIEEILSASLYQGSKRIDIEIRDGTAELVLPQTLEDQIYSLNEDLNALRLRLHDLRVQTGFAEMIGPGLTVAVYDAVNGEGEGALVHDADIRDIVNELYSAGAKGISVGGERLITTSSIRCTGPLVMINYRQIATNPVVIQAVGEPELLVSGLSIIKNELESKRGLKLDVSSSGFIKLPGYVED